ncbi:MAG TPA: D-2-hydroxyacid dehydrogenase [Armatimonadota bacterium]|jgi:phosphoglycerate dehydrogenase-like enzyme
MRIVLSTATWYAGDESLVGPFESSLRASAAGHEVVFVAPGGDLVREVRDAEVFFPLSGHFFTPDVLDAAVSLKWVHLASAGVDHALYPALLKRPIVLTNGAGVYSIPIAEHVLAMMLALSRRIPEMIRQQDRAKWSGLRGGELNGSTVLIVGVGGIGARVAALCKAMGMRVIGTRRRNDIVTPNVDTVLPAGELHGALGEADWVVLCAPLTSETRHIIGAAELAMMKPTTRLINIARGALIDECAMIEALRENRIAGAGLDVFVEEPLPSDSPLWNLPQVIVAPHSGGASPNSLARTLDLFQDNLRRYLAGEPLRNVVDKQAGY